MGIKSLIILKSMSNRHFIQHMQDSRLAFIALMEKHGGAASLLQWMTWEMKNNNSLVIPKEVLASIIGVSIRTLERRMKILKASNFIDMKKRNGFYVIYITTKFAKVGQGYCSFNAKVILSEVDAAQVATQIKIEEIDNSSMINPKKGEVNER